MPAPSPYAIKSPKGSAMRISGIGEVIMSALGIETIDKTVQATNIWLGELDTRLGWDNKHRSWRLLREVLHALRDWLSVDEAVQLGAQMPILIRGIYYDGWDPSKTPAKPRELGDFLARVERAFGGDPLDEPEEAVACVFELLSWHISKGEIADVKQALPKPLRQLWPEK
jgi:uncharacterized protein (DUF2267 family)